MNTSININLIPSDLRTLPQWVNWKYEKRQNNDYAKVPYSPVTGQRADVSNPTTWGTFDQALERANSEPGQLGIGFVFTQQDHYCGIDLDNCINPETRNIELWAWNIVLSLNSYTEVSPSGLGLKIILLGKLPPGRRRTGQIELYDLSRYFTITGNHLPGTPITIEERQDALATLHAHVFGENTQKTQGCVTSLTPQDVALIEQAQTAKNGEHFYALWIGQWQGGQYPYLSQSEADLALCTHLAYWTECDAQRIDKLFRQSGLFRTKWDQKHFSDGRTYGQATIEKAIETINKISNKTNEDTLTRLATLSNIDYDSVRKDEAERMGVRVSILDEEVKKRREGKREGNTGGLPNDELINDIESWTEPVNGAELAYELLKVLKRYAVLPCKADVAFVLWILGTYVYDAFCVFPRLCLKSPEKGCGKTTILIILNALVHRGLLASNITSAAIFRCIDKWHPTLLIDEGDTFLTRSEEMRGIINSSHAREAAYVLRVDGDSSNREPKKFSTWAPMAIAMIKTPPDTIKDRSIMISIQRKLKHEKIDRIPLNLLESCKELRQKCKRWGDDNFQTFTGMTPDIPDVENYRTMDNWLPLLAIADLLGGEWPQWARDTMRVLENVKSQDEGSIGILLLADIKNIFDNTSVDRIFSKSLVDALVELKDRPWCEWRHGKSLTPNSLARLLKPFSISPGSIRDGTNLKGYYKSKFEDAFKRYLTNTSFQNVTTSQINMDAASSVTVHENQNVTPSASDDTGCDVVTVQTEGVEDKYFKTQMGVKEFLYQCRLSNNPNQWEPWLLPTNELAKAVQLLMEMYGQNKVLEVAPGWPSAWCAKVF